MNSPVLSDVSLYELAIASDNPPQPLQMSPTTFKSLVGNVFEVLIEQKIAATIWLKLPKDEAWQVELEQFTQRAIAPYCIYQLQSLQDSKTKSKRATPALALVGGGSPDPLWTEEELSINIESFTLANDSQLRREYFLLVLAEEFQVLALAHRPRSVKAFTELLNAGKIPASLSVPGEEGIEQKHPLLGFHSFEPSTIERVLGGIEQAIQLGQTHLDAETVVQPTGTVWQQAVAQYPNMRLNPVILGRFFARQVFCQEEVWRGSAIHRRQSDVAQELRQENETLRKQQQQQHEFIHHLGQELRMPLTTMKTALSLLNSSNLKQQQRQRYMEMIAQECDRQSSLITGVLDLVRLENTSEVVVMEPLRLMDIVPGVVSTYQPLAQEKGIMLAYLVPEDLAAIACTTQWMKQIVINLLNNSIKYTASGGQVWVKAKPLGDAVQIEFRDTGVGIMAGDLPKVFDCFYRVRQSGDDGSGVGLGLSVVQQIVTRCGGAIAVKSKPGEGAVFTVTLPTYQQD
jgi:two-component system, OmpR family, phosphate regulon sensor histidine kinase PhoR